MKKGFIYLASIRQPWKPFAFEKTEAVLDYEIHAKEALCSPNFSLSPEQAFIFNEGYLFGLIDAKFGVDIDDFNGDDKG